jgi:tetratricopeptide (TPR) repeat protein
MRALFLGLIAALTLSFLLPAPVRAQRFGDILLELDQPAAAVAQVEREAKVGGRIEAFNHKQLHDLWEALADNEPLRLRLLNGLASLNFGPVDPLDQEDQIWEDHARLLAKTGAPPREVLAALKRLVGVDEQLGAALSPRFAAARRLDEAWFEPRAIVMRAFARADRLAVKETDRLSLVTRRADLLERLGRPADALALIDAALLRAKVSPQTFSDLDGGLVNLRAERAFSLWQLGRFDEAIAEDRAIVKDARPREGYDGWADNMLISHLTADGRAQAALKALDYFLYRPNGNLGDWVVARSACVNGQLGRLTAARRELKELTVDTTPARTYALLCLDDLDAAAASYKARLADPDAAPWAIQALSARVRPKALGRWDAVMLDRQAEVAARPDVQAALVAAGGARKSPLTPSGGETW